MWGGWNGVGVSDGGLSPPPSPAGAWLPPRDLSGDLQPPWRLHLSQVPVCGFQQRTGRAHPEGHLCGLERGLQVGSAPSSSCPSSEPFGPIRVEKLDRRPQVATLQPSRASQPVLEHQLGHPPKKISASRHCLACCSPSLQAPPWEEIRRPPTTCGAKIILIILLPVLLKLRDSWSSSSFYDISQSQKR